METQALADGNVKLATAEGVLTDPFNLSAPNFAPVTGGGADAGADFTGLNAFFTPTTYKGAVGADNNWLQGWTRFFTKGQ